MKQAAFLYGIVLALGLCACAAGPSPYERTSYRNLPWAKKSFDEVKALCRDKALRRFAQTDSYEVDVTRFKSCMERYGFHYHGATGVHDNAEQKTLLPPAGIVDKSALYQ